MNDVTLGADRTLSPAAPAVRAEARPRSAVRIAGLHVGVLMLFTALSVWNTWPLVRDLRGHLIEKEDVHMNVWHLWWMRQALWEAPQNPFESPLLHHPIGAELYWHTLSPAKTAFGAPLLAVMEPPTAYNLLLFGTFVLAGWSAWFLLRYLLRRAGVEERLANVAALSGACVFTFSPYHFNQATAHLNLAAIEGVPLYLYFFFRYMDEGRRPLLWGAGASALYVAWCDFYYLLYLALFSLLWIVADRWQRGPLLSFDTPTDPGVRRAAVVAAVCAVFLLPAVTPLLLHLEPAPLAVHHGDSDYYADLSLLVLPDPFSAWLDEMPVRTQSLVRGLATRLMGSNLEETGYFIGWAVPLLCIAGLWMRVPFGRRWAIIGAIFLILSLGTMLQIEGQRRHTPVVLLVIGIIVLLLLRTSVPASWRKRDLVALMLFAVFAGLSKAFTAFGVVYVAEIPLPYLIFKRIAPFYGQAGMPVRFEFMATLAMAVLVAFVAARIGTKLGTKRGRLAGMAAASVVILIPNLDYHRAPMPLVPTPAIPAVFQEIAAAPRDVAVATDAVRGQYEQVFHGHPITFARQSRVPVHEFAFEQSRLIRLLHRHHCDSNVSYEEQVGMRNYLRQHRIRYYVAHWPPCDSIIQNILGGRLLYSDRQIWVYRFDG